jgi:serine/threonine-protein kinase
VEEGRRLDRYRLEQLLNQGEFTEVYRARHELLATRHALKVQRAEVPEEIPEALINEARVQSSLRHRNVLNVSDAFEWNHRIVLVMDYVRSESLADLFGRVGALQLRGALSLFRGIVRGVRALHVSHIVHRDLKPENILLSTEEGRVVPKICDFGMAKLLDPGRPPEPTGLSLSYTFMGTPEYMAPEQAKDPGRVDTRADLFSLGAILYELVTGLMAFESNSASDAMYRAMKADYVDPGALNPKVTPELNDLIAHMLQPRVDDRIATCDLLLARLDQIRC